MNASPFVKPFKQESQEWEATLRFLQVRPCLKASGPCVQLQPPDVLAQAGTHAGLPAKPRGAHVACLC